jgi:hypothetical protein
MLAIDPAATSGWAHNGAGSWTVGTASTWRERYAVVADAWQLEGQGRPLVVVAETWRTNTEGPKKKRSKIGFPQVLSLGAQWGRWLAELERLDVPSKRILLVDTGTWRQAIFGRSRGASDGFKRQAQMRARVVLGHDVGPDEAEALCIGLWGLRSEAVAKALGVRELKRLGWSET